MRQAFSSDFRRSYHEMHGERPADNLRDVTPRNGETLTLREWWAAASPVERFTRVWWWAVCAVAGLGCGIVTAVAFAAAMRLIA